MLQRLPTGALFIFLCQPLLSGAVEIDETDPLFAIDDIFDVEIEAPFTTIMRERSTDEDTPGTLRYGNSDGDIVELDIGIRTRGHYRRRPDVCSFAPLRLNFKKSQVPDTVFDHQNKLKLVTHCQVNSPRYDQFVLKEYLAYRIFNLVTDVSFRARLIRVTYIDSDRADRKSTRLAIIIEHRNQLARRISSAVVKIERATIGQLEPAYTNIASVFHYFIGNLDYSPIAPAIDRDCCHNHALFGLHNEPRFSVPFDFDMSGLVDAPHALPNPRFKIRSVRQRRYRGRCLNNSHLPASVGVFFEQRDNLYALLSAQEMMTRNTRRSTLRFFDDFFKSLDSSAKIERRLGKDCI